MTPGLCKQGPRTFGPVSGHIRLFSHLTKHPPAARCELGQWKSYLPSQQNELEGNTTQASSTLTPERNLAAISFQVTVSLRRMRAGAAGERLAPTTPQTKHRWRRYNSTSKGGWEWNGRDRSVLLSTLLASNFRKAKKQDPRVTHSSQEDLSDRFSMTFTDDLLHRWPCAECGATETWGGMNPNLRELLVPG